MRRARSGTVVYDLNDEAIALFPTLLEYTTLALLQATCRPSWVQALRYMIDTNYDRHKLINLRWSNARLQVTQSQRHGP